MKQSFTDLFSVHHSLTGWLQDGSTFVAPGQGRNNALYLIREISHRSWQCISTARKLVCCSNSSFSLPLSTVFDTKGPSCQLVSRRSAPTGANTSMKWSMWLPLLAAATCSLAHVVRCKSPRMHGVISLTFASPWTNREDSIWSFNRDERCVFLPACEAY